VTVTSAAARPSELRSYCRSWPGKRRSGAACLFVKHFRGQVAVALREQKPPGLCVDALGRTANLATEGLDIVQGPPLRPSAEAFAQHPPKLIGGNPGTEPRHVTLLGQASRTGSFVIVSIAWECCKSFAINLYAGIVAADRSTEECIGPAYLPTVRYVGM